MIQNICNYSYHPNDYVHGLLASHIYYPKHKKGDQVKLQSISKQLGHELPPNPQNIWEIVQVEDDTDGTGYCSNLYVNKNMQQAVLSFQGTQVESIVKILDNKDLKEDLASILANKITKQQALAYKATKNAVNYAKGKGLSLSFTGHSLGGYLAELGVAFCYLDAELDYREVKAVVFDSPGSGEKINLLKSNSTEFDIQKLPIVTYLSAPNIVNSCNGHPGEICIVHPELKLKDWAIKYIEAVKSWPLVGKNMVSIAKCLLSLTGHSLNTILASFDPKTGKPFKYIRIGDWPKFDLKRLNHKSYLGNKGRVGGAIVSKLARIINIPMGGFIGFQAGAFIENKIDERLCLLSSIIGFLLDYKKIDGKQLLQTLEELDENYNKPEDETAENAFRLKYIGHYKESGLKLNQYKVHKHKNKSVDWYLYKLRKYARDKSVIDRLSNGDFTIRVLQNILKDYDIVTISESQYIELNTEQGDIEVLRAKMRRNLEILTAKEIEHAMHSIRTLTAKRLSVRRKADSFARVKNGHEQAKPTHEMNKIVNKSLKRQNFCDRQIDYPHKEEKQYDLKKL